MQLYRSSGNNLYLGMLLENYALLLFGVCMKYLKNPETAKDAVQQVYTIAIREIQKYEVVYIKSWLYMIARNHCLMELRKKQHTLSEEALNSLSAPEPDTLVNGRTEAETHQLLQWIELGLQQIPEPQQQCVTLFYLAKKTYQQITDETGYSILQVKSYIQNGKRNIRIWVEKQIANHGS